MRSKARLTYEQLEETFNGNKNACSPEIMKLAKSLRGAYNALSDAREKRGALNIETTEKVIKINDNGKIDSILPRERLESHKVIRRVHGHSKCMCSRDPRRKMHTCVYRIHDVPSEDKIHDLRKTSPVSVTNWLRGKYYDQNSLIRFCQKQKEPILKKL